MSKLDMADKYPPAESFEDDEPTVKVQVPYFYPQVKVSSDDRDTIPCPPPYEESRYPGVGLLITLGFGLIFWSTLAYFIFR
jgi:hypothetical protein